MDKRTDVFGHYVSGGMARDDLVRFLRELDEHLGEHAALIWGYSGEEDEDVYLYREAFPEILRKSFIVMLVVHVEQEMKELAAAIKKAFETRLALGDLGGSVAERFLRFVSKVAGIDVELTSGEREDFLAVFEMRNCLVHANGRLASFGKRGSVEAFCGRHGSPEISDGMLVINREDCLLCFDSLSRPLDKIYSAAIEEAERRDAKELATRQPD